MDFSVAAETFDLHWSHLGGRPLAARRRLETVDHSKVRQDAHAKTFSHQIGAKALAQLSVNIASEADDRLETFVPPPIEGAWATRAMLEAERDRQVHPGSDGR